MAVHDTKNTEFIAEESLRLDAAWEDESDDYLLECLGESRIKALKRYWVLLNLVAQAVVERAECRRELAGIEARLAECHNRAFRARFLVGYDLEYQDEADHQAFQRDQQAELRQLESRRASVNLRPAELSAEINLLYEQCADELGINMPPIEEFRQTDAKMSA